jgi:hypothetical protein
MERLCGKRAMLGLLDRATQLMFSKGRNGRAPAHAVRARNASRMMGHDRSTHRIAVQE